MTSQSDMSDGTFKLLAGRVLGVPELWSLMVSTSAVSSNVKLSFITSFEIGVWGEEIPVLGVAPS